MVAVECRAPAFGQRQSRLRKADELTLPFRLAGPVRCAGGPLADSQREWLRNAVSILAITCRPIQTQINKYLSPMPMSNAGERTIPNLEEAQSHQLNIKYYIRSSIVVKKTLLSQGF